MPGQAIFCRSTMLLLRHTPPSSLSSDIPQIRGDRTSEEGTKRFPQNLRLQ
ncbi:hypothetical protein HanIR_Chr08g0382001 [Helianthus annuus]|nr:hypothetical protein HanIR_Chr08g0382001 [Helianthus annuus]